MERKKDRDQRNIFSVFGSTWLIDLCRESPFICLSVDVHFYPRQFAFLCHIPAKYSTLLRLSLMVSNPRRIGSDSRILSSTPISTQDEPSKSFHFLSLPLFVPEWQTVYYTVQIISGLWSIILHSFFFLLCHTLQRNLWHTLPVLLTSSTITFHKSV